MKTMKIGEPTVLSFGTGNGETIQLAGYLTSIQYDVHRQPITYGARPFVEFEEMETTVRCEFRAINMPEVTSEADTSVQELLKLLEDKIDEREEDGS